MVSESLAVVLMACVFLGCGDDSSPADAGTDTPRDAGIDATDSGIRDSTIPRPDAMRVDGSVAFDSGPPATGCELLDMDAGTMDAGIPIDPPAPDAFDPITGPGGPQSAFETSEIALRCASLDGGDRDRDHHNTVLMLDGYLWMPWAHEAGVGGISVWEFDEPCAPVSIGTTVDDAMRETHAAGIAFLQGRRWMVTTSLTGIMFWDITDASNPQMVTDMTLPGVVYPDSYARVVMSTFWQAPYVYVGASDNGVFTVDASDPENPVLVEQFEPLPDFRVGGVHVVGNLLVVLPSEGGRSQLFDVSDPGRARAIPGGSFQLTDGTFDRFDRPMLRAAYFGHINGDRAYFARSLLGGGLIIYDISDPTLPTFLGNWPSPDEGANGGYVFVKEGEAFLGVSNYGDVLDLSDETAPTRMARIEMTGDLDTMVPIGNVIVVSVDDDAVPGQASNVMPWKTEPDARAPVVNMVVPRDAEENVALGSRIGVTFDEHVELHTLHPGSFYVRPIDDEGTATGGPLLGHYSGQEGVYNFWPSGPLRPDTRYEVVVPAGGIQDFTGNPTATEFRSTFRTVACE